MPVSQRLNEWAEERIEWLKEQGKLEEGYTLPNQSVGEFRAEFANKSFKDIEALLDDSIVSKEKFEDIYNLMRSQIKREGDKVGPMSEDEFEDALYREGKRICPAWREKMLSRNPQFSQYLLTTDMSMEDVFDKEKRKVAARNLSADAPYWTNKSSENIDSDKQYRLAFHVAQKWVPYFTTCAASLLETRKENKPPLTLNDFCTPEFAQLDEIISWGGIVKPSLQCNQKVKQLDGNNRVWLQEARKLCEKKSKEKNTKGEVKSEKELDQMAIQYATALAERFTQASEFLDCCSSTDSFPIRFSAKSLSIDLRRQVYAVVYENQFINSTEDNIFKRIPSEAVMGCDFYSFMESRQSFEDGVLKGFDYTEINKLEQDLTRVCRGNPEKTAKLMEYAKDGTLFRSIQIESENGHLRATVADSLYTDFGLTPPQRTAQQKAKPKPMSMGGMG